MPIIIRNCTHQTIRETSETAGHFKFKFNIQQQTQSFCLLRGQYGYLSVLYLKRCQTCTLDRNVRHRRQGILRASFSFKRYVPTSIGPKKGNLKQHCLISNFADMWRQCGCNLVIFQQALAHDPVNLESSSLQKSR